MDAAEFRAAGYELIDWIVDYLETVGDRPVMDTIEPGAVRALLPEHPPAAPESFGAVKTDLDAVIVPHLTHWQHPRWFAYFPANTRTRRSSPSW